MSISSARAFGYARVSAADQNLDRQLDALRAFPLDDADIFRDKASGKNFDRPGYRRLMRRLRPGDVLVVKSIDRLGRNYEEILGEWRRITKERRVQMVVLDMPLLDTRTVRDGITGVFLADIVLQILSYVAQVERENIRARQAEGIAAAKARGVRFGRPRIPRPDGYDAVVASYRAGRMTKAAAAASLGVSLSTFGRWLSEDTVGRGQGAAGCGRDVVACRAKGE